MLNLTRCAPFALALMPSVSAQFTVGGGGGLVPAVGTGGGGDSQAILPSSVATFTATTAVPSGAFTLRSVTLNGLTHSWSGDVQVVLRNPSGVGYNLLVRLGVIAPAACCGFSADFNGDYSFVPAGDVTIDQLWPFTDPGAAVAHPSGTYAQEFGTQWGAGWTSGAVNVQNIDVGAIPVVPGIWSLSIYDGAAGDTGGLVGWSMTGGSGAASLGTSYCGPAVLNGSGRAAFLVASGSTVVANNDLRLTARDLPVNQFGIFMTSQTQASIPMAGGSSVGTLCVAGSVGLFNRPGQILDSGSSGSFTRLLDLTMVPVGSGTVAIAAGETWNFQAWFRDRVAGAPPTSNFTDGRSLDFQ